jgi:hypothetical protein
MKTIFCGSPVKYTYTLVHRSFYDFGVFGREYPNGRVRWIIARHCADPSSGSASMEYPTKADAIAVLIRCASDPVPPESVGTSMGQDSRGDHDIDACRKTAATTAGQVTLCLNQELTS